MPVKLGPAQFGGTPVVMVSYGSSHTLVVTRFGRLFSFGKGGDGRLGLGERNDRDVPVEVGPGRFRGAIIAYAAAGYAHSGVVTTGGAAGGGRHGRPNQGAVALRILRSIYPRGTRYRISLEYSRDKVLAFVMGAHEGIYGMQAFRHRRCPTKTIILCYHTCTRKPKHRCQRKQ